MLSSGASLPLMCFTMVTPSPGPPSWGVPWTGSGAGSSLLPRALDGPPGMNMVVGPGGNGLEPPPRSVQVGGGGGHLQPPDTGHLLEKVGAMKQAGQDPPEVRLHPPWGLKMGLGLPASDGDSEEGRWLVRLQGVSGGCLSHLGPHGWLPPCSTCTGEQDCGCGHRGAWLCPGLARPPSGPC